MYFSNSVRAQKKRQISGANLLYAGLPLLGWGKCCESEQKQPPRPAPEAPMPWCWWWGNGEGGVTRLTAATEQTQTPYGLRTSGREIEFTLELLILAH